MISFAQPIMALHVGDITQSALDNLIVVSFSGLSVMQPDIYKARQKILSVLSLLKEIKELELEVEKTSSQFQHLKEAEESAYWV